ncbi:MAG TPA: CarD family transcriptional regulator, partial [Turneriella sp.]|nr:CarD family transcriptional regulator [Turneriella sp.]
MTFAFQDTVQELRSGILNAALPLSALPLTAYLHYQKYPERVLYIVPDDNTALTIHRTLDALQKIHNTNFNTGALVSWGVIAYSYAAADKEKEYLRTQAERLILNNSPCLLIASVEGLTLPIAVDGSAAQSLALKAGMRLERETLVQFLVDAGYTYAEPPPVTKPGEFCVKGGIVDVFPPNLDYAVRIDYFGDDIESIKAFSHETQRSFSTLKDVSLSALKPNLNFLKKELTTLSQKIQKEKLELPPIVSTEGGNPTGYVDIYPALRRTVFLPELWLLQPGTHAFVADAQSALRRAKILSDERAYLYEKSEGKFRVEPTILFLTQEKVEEFFLQTVAIPVEATEKIPTRFAEVKQYGGRLGALKETINENIDKPFYFFIESESQCERLINALQDILIPKIFPYYYPHGFKHESFFFLTENDVFGRVVKKYAGDKKISRILDSYTDLKEGDYIVHVNYGIGKFARLKRMKVSGAQRTGKDGPIGERVVVERDFLELIFAEGDKLFVPLDQLHLVHKYIGSTENPHLDYLGK